MNHVSQDSANAHFLRCKPLEIVMDGYYRLAAVQVAHPELAIFRRYLHLHNVNLLRLQAEIAHLQGELGAQINADRSSGDPVRASYEFNFASLHVFTGPDKPAQLELLDQLRVKLKEHGMAMPNLHTDQHRAY